MLPSIPTSDVPDAPLLTWIVGVMSCSAEGCRPVVKDCERRNSSICHLLVRCIVETVGG